MDSIAQGGGAGGLERRQIIFGAAGREVAGQFESPDVVSSWAVVSWPRGDELAAAVLREWAATAAARGVATLTLPPARGTLRDERARLEDAASWLRAGEAGGAPVHLVVGGRSLAAALRCGGNDIASVAAWSGRPGVLWRRPARARPTLMLIGPGAPRRMRLTSRIAVWRIGQQAHLLHAAGAAEAAETLARWAREPLAPRANAPHFDRRVRRKVVAVSAAAAIAAPLILQPGPTAAAADPFAGGVTIAASQIRGDGITAASQIPPRARRHHANALGAADIRGDGIAPSPMATGSQALVDGSGMKWFVNTNITFSTSSSASGAMSEASFTHAVAATTLNGGTVASTLNDAFDGYNTLCLNVNGAVGSCQTGNANFAIYNKNGPAALDCSGREVVFPAQTIGKLQVSRRVYVPNNDSFARWLNIVTNTSTSPQTVTLSIANNLGSDSNTRIVTTSSGDATADVSDAWVTTFQNYSGTTSSDPRLAHILRGTGAPPLAGINFANGDDNPYWGYTFTLQPGETGIVMDLASAQPSKAAAASKAAELAASPAKIYACMTPTEQGQVLNFAGADLGVTVSGSPSSVGVGGQVSYTVDISNAGPTDASGVTVTATLPAGATYVGASGAGWTCGEASGVVTCTLASLAVGALAPITITVKAPAAPGDATLSVSIASGLPDSSAANNTATATTAVSLFRQALALIAVQGQPDLVVTGVQVSPSKGAYAAGEPVEISVTVKNQGSGAAAPFWVDLYLNPSQSPTVNQTWNMLCGIEPCYGIAWGVAQGLQPGASVTLTSAAGSYAAGQSRWPGYFASGTSQVVVLADSYSPGSTAGAVVESNEANNTASISLSVSGPNPAGANAPARQVIGPRPPSPR